jgi:hypothetical protein
MAKNLAGLGLILTLNTEVVQANELMVNIKLESQIQAVAEEAALAGSEVEQRVQAFIA